MLKDIRAEARRKVVVMMLTYTAPFATTAGSECSSDEGLTSSWRAMEEYTSRRSDAHLLEHVGVQKWEKGHLLEFRYIYSNLEQIQEKTRPGLLTIFKSTNIVKRDVSVYSKRIGIRKG